MVEFEFSYKGKKFNIDVGKCENLFQKMSGLMFRKKSKSLLFTWNKEVSESIHSFFCVDFIAIWFSNERIIDIKYVKPWKIHIKPSKKFDELLEIPVNSSEFNRVKLLISQ